ncbi:unnamed protein product [Jaminaea pallidilutea]
MGHLDEVGTLASPQKAMIGLRRSLMLRVEDEAARKSAQEALERLTELLDRYNLALPTASRPFAETMMAFDDLVSMLTSRLVRDISTEALKKPTSGARKRLLLALGHSCLRHERYNSAVDVFKVADSGQVDLPSQLPDLLIREGSKTMADEQVNLVIRALLRRSSSASENDGEPSVPLSAATWKLIGGHVSRRGKPALLESVWRQILKHYPEEGGSTLIQDQFLVAYSRGGVKTYQLFLDHLSAHYHLPAVLCSEPSGDKPLVNQGVHKRPFDQHTYETVIMGYVQGEAANLRRAEQVLEAMEEEYEPELKTHNYLLNAYARRQDVSGAGRIWRMMIDKSLQPNAMSYELMARMFALKGDIESAFAMLDTLESSNIRPSRGILGIMLSSLAKNGEHERAMKLFRTLLTRDDSAPDVIAWNAMLRILLMRSAPFPRVMRTLQDMEAAGIEPNAATYTLAIQCASEADDMEAAEAFFAKADGAETGFPTETQPRETSDHEEAESFGDEQENEEATSETASTASAATFDPLDADGLGDLRRPRANAQHFTSLIHLHLRLKNIEAAKEYFDEMQRRGLRVEPILWSILASAYAAGESEGSFRLARDIIMRQMDEADRALVDPENGETQLSAGGRYGQTAETLVGPLLGHAARRGDLRRIEAIIGQLESDGIDLSIFTMNILLDGYREIGETSSLMAAWDRIFARARRETGYAAELQLDSSGGVGTSNSPRIDQRRRGSTSRRPILSNVEVPRVQRNALCVSLSIVIDALLADGQHETIATVWAQARAAGFAFDPMNWNALTVALARAGRLEDALRVIENVLNHIRQKPTDHGSQDSEFSRHSSDAYAERQYMRDDAGRRRLESSQNEGPAEDQTMGVTSGTARRRRRTLLDNDRVQREAEEEDSDAQSLLDTVDHDELREETPVARSGHRTSSSREAPDRGRRSHEQRRRPISASRDAASVLLMQALDRQERVDELRSVWTASAATLREVQDALNASGRRENDGQDPADIADGDADAATRKPEAVAVSALLQRYPRAATILDIQARKDRAIQAATTEREESIRAQEYLR